MTKQEMFDKAYIGLRNQQFQKSMDEHGNCMYLGQNGCRCAWGHVDPDGTSHKDAENQSVWGLNEHKIGLAGELHCTDINWAHRLQLCHDDADTAEEMHDRLCNFAEESNLTVPA